jgi:hypothetical protein
VAQWNKVRELATSGNETAQRLVSVGGGTGECIQLLIEHGGRDATNQLTRIPNNERSSTSELKTAVSKAEQAATVGEAETLNGRSTVETATASEQDEALESIEEGGVETLINSPTRNTAVVLDLTGDSEDEDEEEAAKLVMPAKFQGSAQTAGDDTDMAELLLEEEELALEKETFEKTWELKKKRLALKKKRVLLEKKEAMR